MRGLNLIGVFLLLLGIALAATGGFSFEERKKILNTQNTDILIKASPTDNWPWLVGTMAVIGGVVIFLYKSNQRR